MKNIGLNPQIDNFHVTREGAGAAGNASPLTLDATVRTITVPVSANSVTFYPSEPTRIGFAAALADGYFVISGTDSFSFNQEQLASIFYRTDAAVPGAGATLGLHFGMH